MSIRPVLDGGVDGRGDVVVDVGVDVGTTHIKALALDQSGRVLARAARETVWEHPRPEWSELDPATLMVTVAGVLADLVTALATTTTTTTTTTTSTGRGVRCQSIGVTGMAEAGVVLDQSGRIAHPPIAWHDPRVGNVGALLGIADDALGDAFAVATGLPLAPQVSLVKLAWLRDQGVELAGGTWLSVPEFVVHRLGGAPLAERSLAGRTGLVELRTGRPWPRPLEALGLTVPEIRAAGTAWGEAHGPLVPDPMQGAVLTVTGHDHAVASVGAGVGPGAVYDSIGTAEALLVPVEALPGDEDVRALAAAGIEIYPHVLDGLYAAVTGTRSGLALNRVLRLLGGRDVPARDALDAAALEVGERRVPCRLGEDGLEITLAVDDVDPAVLWRSAVTACADRMHERLHLLDRATGRPARRLVLGGGWSAVASVAAARAAWADEVVGSEQPQPGLIASARLGRWAALRLGAGVLSPDHLAGRVRITTPAREEAAR